jgi:hypothetical protein
VRTAGLNGVGIRPQGQTRVRTRTATRRTTSAELTKVGDHIQDILIHGTPPARKALFEALIEAIQILSDDCLIARFRIPTLAGSNGPSLDRPTHEHQEAAEDAVRALPLLMRRQRLEPEPAD